LQLYFLTISERSHTFQLPDGIRIYIFFRISLHCVLWLRFVSCFNKLMTMMSDRKLFDGMLYKEIGVLTTMIMIRPTVI